MFNTKKDRRVVEIEIAFNITAIGEWLKAGGKFEDIDKIKRDEYGSWGDAITQIHKIDMLPIGQTSNAYFHRNKGVISQNIGGIDFLENAKEDIKYIAKKEAKIGMLSWGFRQGSLSLNVKGNGQSNMVLLTPPLIEVVELERNGGLTNPGSLSAEDVKIKVPVSFDERNKPKEFMEIWRRSASKESLGFGNALGHVSFSILNFEVEY